jgi:Holliday junction resolvase RusA-like endonuclease
VIEVEIVVYGIAQPAGSKVPGRTKDGRLFVRDDAKHSRPWKQQVAATAGAQRGNTPTLAGPLSLDVVFYLPRPKGHYGTKGLRPSAPAFPTVRPDATKLLRAVEDALTGIVWRDDAQIVTQTARKRFAEGGPARTVIRVAQLEPQLMEAA